MPSLRSPCRIKCSFVRSAVRRLADRAGAAGRGTAFGNKPHPPAGARERGGVARTDVRAGVPEVRGASAWLGGRPCPAGFGETSRHSAPEFTARGGGWLAA